MGAASSLLFSHQVCIVMDVTSCLGHRLYSCSIFPYSVPSLALLHELRCILYCLPCVEADFFNSRSLLASKDANCYFAISPLEDLVRSLRHGIRRCTANHTLEQRNKAVMV